MTKGWKNPDDGIEHPEMEPPINPEHEKIRCEKIRRAKTGCEKPQAKDKRSAPIEEKSKRGGSHRDFVTDLLARTRHGADYKAITPNVKKMPDGKDER